MQIGTRAGCRSVVVQVALPFLFFRLHPKRCVGWCPEDGDLQAEEEAGGLACTEEGRRFPRSFLGPHVRRKAFQKYGGGGDPPDKTTREGRGAVPPMLGEERREDIWRFSCTCLVSIHVYLHRKRETILLLSVGRIATCGAGVLSPDFFIRLLRTCFFRFRMFFFLSSPWDRQL